MWTHLVWISLDFLTFLTDSKDPGLSALFWHPIPILWYKSGDISNSISLPFSQKSDIRKWSEKLWMYAPTRVIQSSVFTSDYLWNVFFFDRKRKIATRLPVTPIWRNIYLLAEIYHLFYIVSCPCSTRAKNLNNF